MTGMTASIHAFGKLPLAGDFIRYKLDSEESRGFAGWVEKGQILVEAVNRSAGVKPPAAAARRRYLFALDQGFGRRMVAGIMHESNDKGGLRRFPFALFASLEAGGYRSRPALMPIVLDEGWRALEEKMVGFKGAAKVEDLFRGLDGLSFPHAEPSRAEADALDRLLQGEKAGTFWGKVFPGAKKDRRVLLFDVLVRALQPYQSARPEEASVTLKLPLGGGPGEVTAQAAFWIDLLSGILSGARFASEIFLEAPEEGKPPRSLQIFFQRPDEKCFASLMTGKYESEYVDDLTRDLAPMRSGLVLSERHRRLLESDDVSLMELARSRWL